MTSSRFVRFLVTGGFAALVNLGSRYLLNQYMSFEAAVAVAYLFGVVTAYSLARLFVFERSGHAIAS
jgi:putative flippase GtrA